MPQLARVTIVMMALASCGAPQRSGSPAAGPIAPSTAPPASTAESGSAAESGSTASPAPAPSERGAAPAGAAAGEGARSGEFVLRKADDTGPGPANKPSKLTPTATEAALKFTVVDRDKGPVKGIVITLTGTGGRKYYTEETDADGYTEVLVPVGQRYDLVFLSLGRRDIAASVDVSNEKRQSIRLTLRYKRENIDQAAQGGGTGGPRFVLSGVTFDAGKATVRPESFARLDSVVEFMTHKKSARIEISGHTDNVGNPKTNKALSEKRARACRDYLISKGIDGSRIDAVGHGDARPIAPNDTEEGRQKNRRIEATEL